MCIIYYNDYNHHIDYNFKFININIKLFINCIELLFTN